MITSKPLDEKFKELEELLVSGKAEQIRARRGVPFIILLYPPEEEIQVRSRIDTLKRKLEAAGWNIQSFQPEPILFKFLESKGKLQDVFEAERQDPQQLRSKMAFDLFVKNLTEIGRESIPKTAIFVCRAGGFYPHVNIHSLQEQLVNKVKKTTVFFIPAIETEGQEYIFLGKVRTQKYRGYYI
jgi:hypothetical protein